MYILTISNAQFPHAINYLRAKRHLMQTRRVIYILTHELKNDRYQLTSFDLLTGELRAGTIAEINLIRTLRYYHRT